MSDTTIDIFRGDHRTLNLTFTQNGAALDITGYTVKFTVKENVSDSYANAKIAKTVTSHTSPTAGQTQIDITNADTSPLLEQGYFYDIELTDTGSNILTVIRGIFNVTLDITNP